MRRTAQEVLISEFSKRHFAFREVTCNFCEDNVFLEFFLTGIGCGPCCTRCAKTKADFFKIATEVSVASVGSVIRNNENNRLRRETVKAGIANSGLKRIIVSCCAIQNEEMNPDVTQLQMETVSTAESTLRDMENAGENKNSNTK